MSDRQSAQGGPLPRSRQALLVWIAVLPTLTLLQLALGRPLAVFPPYVRPPIIATLVVPIVVFGLLPPLQRLLFPTTAPATSPKEIIRRDRAGEVDRRDQHVRDKDAGAARSSPSGDDRATPHRE